MLLSKYNDTRDRHPQIINVIIRYVPPDPFVSLHPLYLSTIFTPLITYISIHRLYHNWINDSDGARALFMTTDIGPGLVVEGYEFVEPIGEGGFANIWLVKSQKCGLNFVAKVARFCEKDADRAWESFDAEMKALLVLRHPHIIKLYGHFRYGSSFILILEHCPNGSLFDYIKKIGIMRGPVLTHTIRDICGALEYIWSQGE